MRVNYARRAKDAEGGVLHSERRYTFVVDYPLKTNKLIYWIKILLRYSYWISDALFYFFDTFSFVRNILMLLLIRVFISCSLMLLVKC